MTREPLVIIGVISAIIVAACVQLLDDGLVTSKTGQSLVHFVMVLTPIVTVAIGRLFVTPVASPKLEVGTRVDTGDGGAGVVRSA